MNVNDFEEHVDKTILDRGYDYYNDGNIVEFYKKGNSEYVFFIEGSEKYRVDIKIDEGGDMLYSNAFIIYCHCDSA
ncbi:MAG: hypothetical protein LKE46_09325 [Clostridium sp.]|jgi:uncharacterized Zn finger protein|uniref:SWIM zinc finger family protein n=1 Tax=Clostridium sp. TaxID=1506 RepID=UPI0025C2BFB9|nr:hypothetical protein [Clostridium sp.]MCH3964468.1 hypothetical protein [Clostridium sp.]MCI1715642.1 hypothetical protein [Clostridium sp.]MCI1799565.1 hypothetical protein [Clostridium sp.]MCI1813826.1 hypothetical protein [Clostridium sp.]MCI1870377.1 hypothetical protein [Clostridium sp.]